MVSSTGDGRTVSADVGGVLPVDRLSRLARRNEAILHSSMDGFFVVDGDCRFLDANEAFCRMTGFSRPELLNMRISDLEVQETASGGLPAHTRTGLHHFPAAHRHKDGHLIHLEVSVNVLNDEDGKILVGFARDVTERRRTELELARLTRQRKLILDSAAECIVGLDHDGHATFVNPAAARSLGCSAGDAIGQDMHVRMLGVDARRDPCRRDECPICSVLRRGASALRTEDEFCRPDGSRFPVACSAAAMHEGARVIGAVLVFEDITRRRRAEEERRAREAHQQCAQRLEGLGLLAGGIAHDLNNILVGILGNSYLALADLPEDSRAASRLQRVVNACQRAAKVIRQILTYSGRHSSEMCPIDLNESLHDMAEFMRAALPRNVSLALMPDPKPLVIEADTGQLQQVLTNLLVNASEAIGDRAGKITISTQRQQLLGDESSRGFVGEPLKNGEYALLRVADNGCGMAPETVERIFEPFFSSKGPGRGLGLAALHGVIRSHHGAVRVESGAGHGTTFTIAFPLLSQVADAIAESGAPAREAEGLSVLVIDDEACVREVIESMLIDRGVRVHSAADGSEGIELFRTYQHEIDVVLLDLTMPGRSGHEVMQELRAIDPAVRIVIVSGYSEGEVSARSPGAPADDFLRKPFTLQALLEHVRPHPRRAKG